MKTLQQLRKAKFFLTVLLSLLFILTATQQTYATHAAGSDIQFQCLGGLQYKINVTFYRDCGGVAEPSNITINYKSTNGSVNSNVTANKIANTGQEITIPCTGVTTTCNGGTGTGIRQFIYSATVTLPSAQTDWVFSYNVCCRNCAITTITNPCASNSVLYIEATLNNVLAPCDNSPTFSNIPIAFVCAGQNFNYNHGVLDPDGDSLAYQLITPKTSATGTVTFISPASATSPIASSTPFTLNAGTGDLNFTPSQIQIGILALLVKEYRNGHLIGSVIRDMQIYTTACSNNLPTATGINGTSNFTTTVCPNTPVCFTVNTNDADAGQIVTLTTNNGIPGATYTIGSGPHPTLNFCWTPTVNDISLLPHTFTITVKDNACPNNGTQTYSYNIYVPSPYFTISSTNINCNGAATGTANASPVYSGNNYIYNWSNGATTATINNVPAGTYLVTVTDISGCSATQSTTITEPSGMTLTTVNTSPSCGNVSNGAIDLTVSGGIAPYTYLWSNGQTTQDISNVNAGSYTVTVTDAHNCTKTNTVTLSNSYSISVSTSATNVSCFGNNTGSITSTLTGGSSPFTYSWSNGSSSTNLTNIIAGTYTLTVTDHNGCIANSTATVTQPAAALAISLSKTNVNCFGNSTGTASAIASGGTTPYTYLWNNGATTASISTLAAATYTLTVSDGHGCTASGSVIVSQPVAALTTTSTKTNVKCFGNNTGAASVTASGGTTPYTYLWNNGNTTSAITNLIAGNYTATITDANNCTTTTTISITQPAAALNVSASATTVNCFGGNNANVTATVSGGTTGYSYAWNNGSTNQNLSNVIAGVYTITVTDANNCTSSASATVTQPGAALSTTVSKTNVSCFGNSTGSGNVSASGGTSPYNYLWSNGATTASINSLAAGTYTVTVTDSKGCTSTNSISVTQPLAALSSTSSKTNVKCFGNNTGAASVIASGGTTPYTYLWNNGNTTSAINNLTAGNYSVTITDANNCTTSANFTINQPVAALNVSASATTVNCFGGNNASVTTTISGGTTAYSYLWNNGSTNQNLSNVIAGVYTITVTDANNCTSSASATVTQPSAALNVSYSSTNILCFGNATGAIALTVTGGTSAYSYNWSNGATTSSLNNIVAGTYNVTVTDIRNCTSTASVTLTQPGAALNITTTKTNVLCYGNATGAASVSASGGTSPYSYQWSNGSTNSGINNIISGTYTVTVTDANNCSAIGTVSISQPAAALSQTTSTTNVKCYGDHTGSTSINVSGGTTPYTYQWNNGVGTSTNTGIIAGNYSVTVTDANGCSVSASTTVSQPAAGLSAVVNATDVKCFGLNTGALATTVSGGTSPYIYNWNNGATSASLTAINSGSYTVTITDQNNCSTTAFGIVNQPAAPLSIITASTNINCKGANNGTANVTAYDGTAPYIYNWSNGSSADNISNLSPGNYTVTVTDANNCSAMGTVSITQPATNISLSATHQDINCLGNGAGSIDLTATGGTPNYSFNWSNGSTTEDDAYLPAGIYTVTVTDANNCTASLTQTISQPAGVITVTSQVTNINCFGGTEGAINLTTTLGTPPYQFTWSNGNTTEDLSNLIAGAYTATITDANGCVLANTYFVTQPTAPLSGSMQANDVLCFGDLSGDLILDANGGTSPYNYNWSNGATTQDIISVASGTYSVSITDANGCTANVSGTIQQPAQPLSSTAQVTSLNCHDVQDGAINISVTGGTAPYSYVWSNGQSIEDLSGLSVGDYTVTITDANNCSITNSYSIIYNAATLSASAIITAVNCHGDATGAIDLTVTGGTTPYSYNWDNGSVTEDLSATAAGQYAVTVTDANGCTTNYNGSISEPNAPLTATHTVSKSLCYGDSTGTIDLTTNGGTTPYSFTWSNGGKSEDLVGLPAGTYDINIIDANGCTYAESIKLDGPPAPLGITYQGTDPLCYGDNTGSITTNVHGGTPNYIIAWNTQSSQNNLTNLIAGTYTIQVTDSNGCLTNQTIILNQPAAPISVQPTITNVDCNSNSTGSVTLNSSGGTAPYTYVWSNNANADLNTGLISGNYQYTITDSHQCILQGNVDVAQPANALAVANQLTQVGCNGNSTGAIDLTLSGGTAPYAVNWNNGSTTEDLSSLAAGNYSVIIQDANGCAYTQSYTITEPIANLSQQATIVNAGCTGQNTGSVSVTANGGTAPYTYSWSDGSSQSTINNANAGDYTLLITDNNGCTSSALYTITQPNAVLSTTPATTAVSCNGNNNGTADITATGGTAPYTYSWSNGATTNSVSGLVAGNYQYTITDVNQCTVQGSITINEPAAALSATNQVTPISCFGNSTGAIDLTLSGGTAPYSVSWDNGSNTEDLTGIAAGNYSATIQDANGCAYTQTVTVSQPAAGLTQQGTIVNAGCTGQNTGSITVTTSGGTSPYIYSWSDGTSASAINNASAGNYTVLITDNNGCTSTGNYTITQPAGSLNATATTVTSASCNGSTNGAIDITITGGTGPYIYTWSNGSSTEDLSNLSAGNYTVSIVDANQCSTQISVTIQQPSAPVGITYLVTDAKCFGDNSGAIIAQISGGTAPYSYSWNNGSTSSSLTSMQAGIYSLTVTDANGCSLQMPVSISQPNAPVSAAMIPHNIACNGTNTGWIDLTVVGGMGNYNYQWNNGGTIEDPTNLPAGNYYCVITDQNGCTATGNATITAPANPVIINSTVNNVTCSGGNTGAITLNVSGGTPGYTYLWNNGSQSSSLTAMPMGSYTVTVTDANGCTEQTTASISSASGITIASSIQNAGCNSSTGSITLTVSGGTPNYTFAWSNGSQTSSINNLQGGNYTVTVTDGNGCSEQTSLTITEVNSNITSTSSTVAANCLSGQQGSINITANGGTAPYSYSWNNGATSQNVNNLLPGNYTVTITDANGCVYTQSTSVADSSSLAIHSIEGTNICIGNTATITTDPIAGATLQWQYNGVPLTGAVTNTFVTPVGGTYQLVATTPCGVYTSNPVEIVVRSLNNVSINNNVIVCPGESVQLQAGGGVNYVWTPTVGLSNPNVANPMASPTESTTYTVNVKDSYGCTASASVFVAVMCDTLNIPNGFSPNGDGTNDFFVIKGLDNYPGTTIFIYNRWGNLVYKKQDYQNDWNGQSNVSGVLIGQDLPNGTYFYILDLKTDTKPLNGYVVIRR